MNSLPFEPKQFIFWHTHAINEQKQLIVQSATWSLLTRLWGYAGMASQALLHLISDT